MLHARPVALALCAAHLASGCIDSGYQVEPARLYQDEDEPGTVPEDCVEGEAAPLDDGPRINFIALNVDQPVLRIRPGDTVTFVNTDSQRHTATAGAPNAEVPPEAGGFESGTMNTGARWAFRFCDPRTVIWFCRTHPAQMRDYLILIE